MLDLIKGDRLSSRRGERMRQERLAWRTIKRVKIGDERESRDEKEGRSKVDVSHDQ